MRVTAKVEDNGVGKRFEVMPIVLDAAVRKGVAKLSGMAQREITGTEGLSKYPRHAAGTKTPSPAGEPPAQVSTMLRRTVTIMPTRRIGFAHYSQETMPTMAYARILELGGLINLPQGGTAIMPARPYVAPARKRLVGSGRAKEVFREQVVRELMKRGR